MNEYGTMRSVSMKTPEKMSKPAMMSSGKGQTGPPGTYEGGGGGSCGKPEASSVFPGWRRARNGLKSSTTAWRVKRMSHQMPTPKGIP